MSNILAHSCESIQMVQFTAVNLAFVAAPGGAAAKSCLLATDLCGYHLNDGIKRKESPFGPII